MDDKNSYTCPNVTIIDIQTYTRRIHKKKANFCYKDFIVQRFKHRPLQSSPLCWQYTIPNVSNIVGMLPGTHIL
jgi:hypothetical protein